MAAGVLLVAELVAWEGQNNLEKDDGSVYREQFHKNACFIAFYLILGTLAYFTLQLGEQLSLEDPTSAKYICHHKLLYKCLLSIFIPLKSIFINGLKKDRFSRNKLLVAGNEPTTNQKLSNRVNHRPRTTARLDYDGLSSNLNSSLITVKLSHEEYQAIAVHELAHQLVSVLLAELIHLREVTDGRAS